MKKIVALGVFYVMVTFTLQAQNDIRFGVQVSPTFSWMNTSTNRINPSGTNLGLKLGMIGEFYFRENYAITSGIGFAFNHGGTLQHEVGGKYWTKSELSSALDTLPSGVKLKYGIQYIEIPIALKMRTREFGYIRYFVEPGFVLGFKSQAKGTINGVGVGDEATDIDIRKEVNLLNLSVGVNAGIEYTLSESTSLIGGIGFQTSFTDVTDDNGTAFDARRSWPERNPKEDSKGKVNVFVIKLGVIF